MEVLLTVCIIYVSHRSRYHLTNDKHSSEPIHISKTHLPKSLQQTKKIKAQTPHTKSNTNDTSNIHPQYDSTSIHKTHRTGNLGSEPPAINPILRFHMSLRRSKILNPTKHSLSEITLLISNGDLKCTRVMLDFGRSDKKRDLHACISRGM